MDTAIFIVQMIILGCGVGIVSAALGIGGGVLMVPAFLYLYPNLDIHTAKGSSMLIIMFVAAFNAYRMNQGDMKNPIKLVAIIAIGSVMGSYLGAWTTSLLNDKNASWFFIGLLFFAGARAFLLKEPKVAEEDVKNRNQLAAIIGFVAGFVAGATGTGGGAMFVPLALWAGIVSNYRVVALSNAVMVISAASGLIAHLMSRQTVDMPWTVGMVNLSFAPFVIAGAIAAAPIGRKLNQHLSIERRRLVMGALLMIITVRLIFRTLS
jgi:uncharacterized protein